MHVKLFEDFHGNYMRPEMVEDNVANYTGVPVKRNGEKWLAFPKVGDTVNVINDSRAGFASSALEPMKIVDMDLNNKVILCDCDGIETPIKFMSSPATDVGTILYFTKAE